MKSCCCPRQQNKFTVDAEYESTGRIQHESLLEKFTIRTGGLSAKAPFDVKRNSGIFDTENRKVLCFKQGYNIITIEDGLFVRKAFHIWKHDAEEMAAYLESIPHGQTVIISTMDEAKDNRFSNGIANLIYDIGGSKAIFGGDMKWRSVYILVGQKGAGPGKGKEYYRGAIDEDSNAWLTTEFFVSGDKIYSENGAAQVLLDTIKYLGNNVQLYPCPKEVYESSPSKPFEVEDLEESRKRNRFNLKASFFF